MKVMELLEILGEMAPEATVLLAVQVSWPFECELQGACQRRDLKDAGADDEPQREDGELANNDVLLVEGRQLRYGLPRP